MGCHKEREGMLRCTTCLRAWFCSAQCQRKEWENHKSQCHEIVTKTIQLAKKIKLQRDGTRRFPGMSYTYYWGNVPAVDLINLSMNEGEEYSDPLALLLCGVGDPRNVLLTIASLPDVYEQQVTFVLNDICPCTLARTVLLLYMLYKGGSEAVDAVIRVWYSLRISEFDFSQLMSALEELVTTRDLKTLAGDLMNIASPGQLSELKRVWRTWAQLSTRKGRWVTERREAAFKRDSDVEIVMREYLMAVSQNHRESVERWRADGLFRLQCKASSLTRENVTFTGSSFQNERGRGDYDFSPRPCVLPFTGWDYLEVKKTSFDDSLPKMYGVYLSRILHKCVERLSRSELKLHILLCNCLQIQPCLPLGLSYDRIATSNLCDYISFTTMLTQFKAYLNPNNRYSILNTEAFHWLDCYLPETSKEISRMACDDISYPETVLRDTKNPLLVLTAPTSYVEYHNLIPEFQLYLRAALIESQSDEELSSTAKSNKLPSIKAIITALGLELRDYVRNENKVFPFKWAVNRRRVTRMKGYEFALEWKLPTPAQ
ncbi:hypothetical protein ACROYT_G012875 [Oculina patagonica]